jgi:hypothetical protein
MVPFKELIAILGGWTVITIGVIAAATKLMNERIFSKWRREEQFTLEGLKHSFSSERLLLEATIRGSQQGRDASHEKVLPPARMANLQEPSKSSRLRQSDTETRTHTSRPKTIAHCCTPTSANKPSLTQNPPQRFESSENQLKIVRSSCIANIATKPNGKSFSEST